MDAATAAWLVTPDAADALAAASAEADPGSLAAGARLRRRVAPDRAAAVLAQVALRRKAVGKFGAGADDLFFTVDGLEQATRGPVAARRAALFAAAGVRHVVDLGCGIGADALALQRAGLRVTAVERDAATALLAGANLGEDVLVADAQAAWPALAAADPEAGVFADPARRTASGRSWRVEDLSPPWTFVTGLLDAARVACVKLGPGVPLALVPDHVSAEWVSDGGSVVECALWSGHDAVPGRRTAVVDGVELVGSAHAPEVEVTGVEEWLYEPDGAVVRAGLVPQLAGLLRATRVDAGVAYLTAPWHLPTPFATAFEVAEILPFDERVLRAWVRDHGVGTLEIKKRGIDIDPADLRKRLRPKGAASATLVLTPTPTGARVLVVRRA